MTYPKIKKFKTTARLMVEGDKIIDKKSLSDSINSWKQGYEYQKKC